jgi:septal ring factor EnvC (AmiA/AmiB activator)
MNLKMIAAAVVALLFLAQTFALFIARDQLAACRQHNAEIRSEYDAASVQAQADIRALEQKRAVIVAQIQQEAANDLQTLQAAADSASADADSLRNEVRRLRSRIATADATTAGRSKAESSAFGVLAELFDESVRRNQVLAAEADGARRRGMTCERIYDEQK